MLRTGNPCAHPMVEEYLAFTAAEQNRVGVTVYQAAPLLENTLGALLAHMRLRAQAAESVLGPCKALAEGGPIDPLYHALLPSGRFSQQDDGRRGHRTNHAGGGMEDRGDREVLRRAVCQTAAGPGL